MGLGSALILRSLAAVLAIVTLPAASRADVVILRNGDRMSGEIRQLENRRLTIQTAYAGAVNIDWRMVEQLSTQGLFLVETESGRRLQGSIAGSPAGLLIQSGQKRTHVPLLGVASIRPAAPEPPRSFWRRVEGTADLGYSLTRGNSDLSQSSLGISARYRAEKYQLQAGLDSLFARQSEAPATSRHSGSLRYDLFLRPQAFMFTLAGLERDDRQRLNLRTNLGGGMGVSVIKSEKTTLSLLGGMTFVDERFRRDEQSGVAPRNSSGEGLVGLDFETAAANRVRLTSRLSLHPNLVVRGRYRLALESGVRIPVASRFTWNLRLFDRFDSEPPLRTLRNDYGLVSSFGVTF